MSIGPTRDLGPCEVWYNGAKVGEYFETVQFQHSDNDADVFEASQGVTPVDSIRIGMGPCLATVPFTRTSEADLAIITPGGSHSSGGATSGNVRVYNNQIGRSEYDGSAELILKPIVDSAVSNSQYWLTIPHAAPSADYSLEYDSAKQRIYNVKFKGFPDATTKEVWRVGPIT